MLRTLIPAFLACILLAGCDYPEAGFFELTVRDGAKEIASFPFMIEELTDDTDLTIGFNLLLPTRGELVIYNLKNSEDLSRRGWDLRLAQADSGYDDIQLTLIHANDQLSFSGVVRDPDAGQSARFRGADLHEFAGSVNSSEQSDPGAVVFSTLLPTTLLAGRATGASWQLRPISQAQFERVLGAKVAVAARREAPYLAALRETPVKPEVEPAKVRPGRYKRDKLGGDRKVGP